MDHIGNTLHSCSVWLYALLSNELFTKNLVFAVTYLPSRCVAVRHNILKTVRWQAFPEFTGTLNFFVNVIYIYCFRFVNVLRSSIFHLLFTLQKIHKLTKENLQHNTKQRKLECRMSEVIHCVQNVYKNKVLCSCTL